MLNRRKLFQYIFGVLVVLILRAAFTFGADWDAANTNLANLDVYSLAVDPTNPRMIYAGGSGGVFKSLDGGESWTITGLASTPQTFTTLPCCNLPRPLTASSVVLQLAIDSTNPDVLYAGTHWRQSCVYLQRRVFKSVDGGANWTDSISPNINGCDNIHALVLAPSDPKTLYIAAFDDMGDTWSPLIRSNDAMDSWTYLGFPTTQVLAVDPVDSKTLYRGSFPFAPYFTPLPNGVSKSIDGGATWNPTSLTDTGITVLTVDPRDRRTVYAGTGSESDYCDPCGAEVTWHPGGFRGLFKSIDGGGSWTEIDNGLGHLLGSRSVIMTSLLVDPNNSNILYAGTSGAGVFKSVDAGATWTGFNDGLRSPIIRSLAMSAGKPSTVYAATPSGVFKIDGDTPTLLIDARQYCAGSPWKLRLIRGAPNSPITLLGTTEGQSWHIQQWRQSDTVGNVTAEEIFREGTQGSHTLRVEVGGLLSNTVAFTVTECTP
jgi:photosystem II stability/assembly factor-like uncharacterized protein